MPDPEVGLTPTRPWNPRWLGSVTILAVELGKQKAGGVDSDAVTLLLLSVTLSAQGEEFRGRVVRILDGDTLEVRRNARPVRIRLAEVDCPEKGQAFGTRARQFSGSLTFGREVTVRPPGVDRYGPMVAEVVLADRRTLNRELVRAGLAWHYKRYSSNANLRLWKPRREQHAEACGSIHIQFRHGSFAATERVISRNQLWEASCAGHGGTEPGAGRPFWSGWN